GCRATEIVGAARWTELVGSGKDPHAADRARDYTGMRHLPSFKKCVQVGSRAGAVLRRVRLGCFRRFQLGCPVSRPRESVSNPRPVEPDVRISRIRLSCTLRTKGYGTYHAGSAI